MSKFFRMDVFGQRSRGCIGYIQRGVYEKQLHAKEEEVMMGIKVVFASGIVAIVLTVLVLSGLLLFDWTRKRLRTKAYQRLIQRKMALLEQVQQERFTQEPVLSKVFKPNFGKTMEVKL